MSSSGAADVWASGAAYESYVGRWSRAVARQFVPWLSTGTARRWLDVGCGTAILTRIILELEGPAPGYVASLDEPRRTALREAIRAALAVAPDGRIHLSARAWAIRGELDAAVL